MTGLRGRWPIWGIRSAIRRSGDSRDAHRRGARNLAAKLLRALHGASGGACALSRQRPVEGHRRACPCSFRRPGHRRRGQFAHPSGGRGCRKNGASTPCTGTCTRRNAAKRDRSAQGSHAGRRPLGVGRCAACTALAAAHQPAGGMAAIAMASALPRQSRSNAPCAHSCDTHAKHSRD
jgi:hypothetical protein